MLIAYILVQLPRDVAFKAAQALCERSYSSHGGRVLNYVFEDYSRLHSHRRATTVARSFQTLRGITMSPNDPRVALRRRILEIAGYVTNDNGISYQSGPSDHRRWMYETTFPYDRFIAIDENGHVQDAWVQEYPGDAK